MSGERMEIEELGKRVPISSEHPGYAYGAQIPQMITAATKARRDEEFGIYLGEIGMSKDDFLTKLGEKKCKLEDFYTYLDALTLADENPDESLDDLIEQLSTIKISGGGMRQVGGSLGAILALHIKIFKNPNFARLTVGASMLLLQNTIELLNSLDKCFVYYGRALLTKILDWMMTVCKDLYDNRDSIGRSVASGAKTVASAAGTAAVATPGVILDILRGVDVLGMKFAAWYNPETNGFDEFLDAVKRRNEEYHALMDELAAEQAEVAGKETDRTMELQNKKFVAQKKVDSMTAIREASEAAGRLHEQLTEEIAGLDHKLVMGQVKDKGKGKGKTGALKAPSNRPVKYSPKQVSPGLGPERVPHAKGVPSAGAGMELGDSESDLGKGGKRATRKRGKRSSKRGSRKTKTTRKKRRGKK
jgi:hypothetical protein